MGANIDEGIYQFSSGEFAQNAPSIHLLFSNHKDKRCCWIVVICAHCVRGSVHPVGLHGGARPETSGLTVVLIPILGMSGSARPEASGLAVCAHCVRRGLRMEAVLVMQMGNISPN